MTLYYLNSTSTDSYFFRVYKTFLSENKRKLNSEWTIESTQDWKIIYGIDSSNNILNKKSFKLPDYLFNMN